MSYNFYDNTVNEPHSVSQPILSRLSSANFFVAPMGNGKPARIMERGKPNGEKEGADPGGEIGMSILSTLFLGALGLPPMMHLGVEAMLAARDFSEGQPTSSQVVPDVNLDPAALLRPDLAFNFRKMGEAKEAACEKDEEERKKKLGLRGADVRFLSTQQSKRRSTPRGSALVPPLRGFGTPSLRM